MAKTDIELRSSAGLHLLNARAEGSSSTAYPSFPISQASLVVIESPRRRHEIRTKCRACN